MGISTNAWRFCGALLAAALTIGPGCGSPEPSPPAPSGAPDAGAAETSSGLAQALSLARADRGLDRFLSDSARGFERSGDGFTSPGFRGVGAASTRIAARLPHRAELAYQVGLGPDPRGAIRLWREGAAGSDAELAEGRLLYADAYPSTDLIAVSSMSRYEELFLLEDEHAPARFSWRFELPAGMPHVSEQPDGALAFLDASGQPAIRLDKPFALDARGEKRDAELRVEGDRIVIELDPAGLSYPVLLDPAWDVAAWTLVNGNSPPAGRYWHAMAYHAASSVLLMFGGYDITVSPPTLADSWALSGSTWSAAAAGPPARRNHAMAYDAARQETVMFGGYDNLAVPSTRGDTWVYTTAGGWTQKCTTCVAGTDTPSPRYGHTMAYDSVLQRVLLFGGNPGSGSNNEIWEWNGGTGKWAKRCGAGCSAPSARTSHAMAYDAQNARTVIYGGVPAALPDVTVLYNSATDTFTTATTPVALGQRSLSGMGYDSVRKKVLLFGGKPGSTPTNEVWQWDGGAWAQLPSTAGPTARSATPLTFDPANKRFVVFSGDTVTPDPNDPKDTWALIVRGDQCATGATCDTGYCVDGVCCTTSSCGVCERCDSGFAGGIPGSGVCTKVTGADDDTCNGANTCNGSSVCKKKNGQSCTLAADCASNNCVDGTCCADTCTAECRSCANPSGACTTLVTNQDDSTCTGANTCNGSGVCKKKNGQSCTLATECASNSCVDGTCCADACTTPCRSCANSSGTCTTLVTGQEDGTACSGINSCDGSGNCKKKKGQGCSAGTECVSGQCVDNYCCDTACGGGCDVCSAALGASQNGTCTVLGAGSTGQCGAYKCAGAASCPTTCSGDASCTAGNYCAGTACAAKKANGTSCAGANECASGNCVDGVCCDTTCTGKCYACAAANKEDSNPANSGKCGAAKKGTNPGSQCVASSDPCGDQASCSGTPGECAKGPAGTSCGPTTCTNGAVTGKVCNGSGLCIDQANAQCTPYVCKGSACSSPCSADTDCVNDYYCSSGVCVAKSDNGKACSAGNTCKSGFCADGVCCDGPCSGQCQACAEIGSVGQCKVVTGDPRSPRPACLGATGDKCKGACDGANPNACTYPAAGTACKDASCTGDVSQPAGTCDGAGLCSLPSTKNCLPYACNATSGDCKATCASDADCAQGSKCDTTTGKCAVTSATCKDATTVLQPNGQTQSCEPYKCLGGACQQQCSTSSDCATGYVCQGTACVADEAGAGGTSGTGGASTGGASTGGGSSGGSSSGGSSSGGNSAGGKKGDSGGDDGGCGCRVPASGGGPKPYWLGALALGALRRRRGRPHH